MKHIYSLKEGESYTFFKGAVIVAHSERPPKIIDCNGIEDVLIFGTTAFKIGGKDIRFSELFDV